MTGHDQIDSRLSRGLDCVESQAVAQRGCGTQREFFFKKGTDVFSAGIYSVQQPSQQRRRSWSVIYYHSVHLTE